jgi:hypothetical protein
MNANFETIGKAFIDHYYKLFDTNRAELKAFYVSDLVILNNHKTELVNVICIHCGGNKTDFIVLIAEG